jgi:hypothetical protein
MSNEEAYDHYQVETLRIFTPDHVKDEAEAGNRCIDFCLNPRKGRTRCSPDSITGKFTGPGLLG